MNKEVAMIISTLIQNIGKMDDTIDAAKKTIKAIDILKRQWSDQNSIEEKQFDSIIEALEVIYDLKAIEEKQKKH